MWTIFFVVHLNIVNAVYFSMAHLEAHIPLQDNEINEVILPKVQAQDGDGIKYWIQNFNKLGKDVVTVDESSETLHLFSTGALNTSLKVTAIDGTNRTSSTYLKVFLQSGAKCNHQIFDSLCFWTKIIYQVKENSSPVNLGSLSPIYDFNGCGIKSISYIMESDKEMFKLYPPTTKIKYWTIGTIMPLNRTLHGKELNFNVSCLLTTVSEISKYTKPFKLKIIDHDANFPLPKRKNVYVEYRDTKIKKGETVIRDLIFINDDLSDRNTYSYFISSDNISDFLQPQCHTNHKIKTKIYCPAPYARVTQPHEHENENGNYKIKTLNAKRNPFNITREGIVYVTNTQALRNCPEFLRLNISWIKGNLTKNENIVVRVVDEPTKTCENITDNDWTFCSHFSTQKSCQSKHSCALGTGGVTNVEYRAGPQRCLWRGDRNPDNHETHLYSTCSADTKYCPDGICDSLEELVEKELCPQDCSVDTLFPTKVNEITKKGIDKCNGILVCDLHCICIVNITKPTVMHVQPKENKLIAETECGAKCIIGAAGGLLLFGCIITGFVVIWKKNRGKKLEEKYIHNMQEAETPFSDYIERNTEPMVLNFHISTPINSNNTLYNNIKPKEIDAKWEFPREHILIDQILGEGEFGKVLKAKAFNIAGRPGYSLVAVKTLKDDARKQDYHDLFSEYQLLKEVSHPHVIELLGICSSNEGPLFVIIEYAELGSLRNYLRRSRHLLTSAELAAMDDDLNNKVTAKDILSFARQIASGMSYLSDIKLVHRDLAARNILLAKDKVCKISDFGLTRDIYEDNAYFKKSKGRVPVKWMAPESLADHVYTTKSDVWSFGILIWELVTLGASPYPGLPVHNLYNLLKQGYRMERPPNCAIVLYSLMNRCWNIDPDKRPFFLELYHCFDNLLTDNVNYLDLSDNAIINKCYFSSLTDTDKISPDSEDVNLLENYLEKEKNSHIAEKCKIKEYPKELNICLGYETPVKISRPVTPTNQNPEEYTDMTAKE